MQARRLRTYLARDTPSERDPSRTQPRDQLAWSRTQSRDQLAWSRTQPRDQLGWSRHALPHASRAQARGTRHATGHATRVRRYVTGLRSLWVDWVALASKVLLGR